MIRLSLVDIPSVSDEARIYCPLQLATAELSPRTKTKNSNASFIGIISAFVPSPSACRAEVTLESGNRMSKRRADFVNFTAGLPDIKVARTALPLMKRKPTA
jgi:hypothetical protein